MPARFLGAYLTDKLMADGGSVLSGVPKWLSLGTIQRLDGDDSLDGTLPHTFDAESILPLTQCVQLRREDASIEEWPILTWNRTRPKGNIAISAAPARTILKLQSLMIVEAGDDVLLNATADGLTPTEILDTYILPRCPDWVVRNVVEPTDPIPQWSVSAANGLQSVLALVDAINGSRLSPATATCYFFFERLSATQWGISIRRTFSDTPITAGLPKNLSQFIAGQSRLEQITQLLPTDGNGLTAANCWFVITAISGTDVTLASWDDAASDVPIGFDDQLNGDYIVEADGVTCHAITASVASTQTVTVTSATGLSVGDRVGLARDSSGKRKVVWTDPGNAFTSADFLTVPDAVSRINWVRNAKFDLWTSGLPDHWSHDDVGWGTGGTVTQETNPTNIESPPGIYAVKHQPSAQGQVNAAIRQTWPMPYALRNRVWSVRVRVFFPTGYPYAFYLAIHTARGWSSQIFVISDVPLSNYQWFTLTVDESAAGLGAWTGGIALCGLDGGNVNGPVWSERCEFVEGDTTDSINVTFGCGPNRLIHTTNLELAATRDASSSYELTIIDRARQNLARYPNDVILPGRRIRPIVGSIDQSLPVLQVQTDELHRTKTSVLLSSEVPRLTSQTGGGGGGSGLTGDGGTIGTVPVVEQTPGASGPVLPGTGVLGPGSPVLRAYYTADLGIGVADGSPVPTWADQSGNALDLAGSGSARPTFLADPDGDGMPLVRFDGSANGLKLTGLSAYTGTDLTIFLVARVIHAASTTKKIAALATSGGDEVTGQMNIRTDDSGGIRIRRSGQEYQGNAVTSGTGGTSFSSGVSEWVVFVARWATILGRGVLTVRTNLTSASYDLGSSPPPAWSYTALTLGAGWNGSALQQFTQGDVRAFGIYHTALRDDQMRDLLRYLGTHWKIASVG